MTNNCQELPRLMLAGRYTAPGEIQAMELPVPLLEDSKALVQIEACGICGSDLGIVAGLHPRAKAPLTLGHEVCGRVLQVRGEHENGIQEGDRVALYPLLSCGHCLMCRRGQAHVCRTLHLYGIDADGGLAEFATFPLGNLLKIPDTVGPDVGALLEPLAVAIHATSRLQIDPTDSVLVMGAGTVGLLLALVLRHHGVKRIFVSDIVRSRIELSESLGFTALDGSNPQYSDVIRQGTDREGADIVFEASGSHSAAIEMTQIARCQGAVVIVSVFKKPVPMNMMDVNFKELRVCGSRVYSVGDFRSAVRIAPRLPLGKLVAHRFALAQITDAFRTFESGKGGKVLVRPNS
jgi:(R,R)-butanediol dehydrogenase / meso-butanediol dehydrogenase / diacetyl reductase